MADKQLPPEPEGPVLTTDNEQDRVELIPDHGPQQEADGRDGGQPGLAPPATPPEKAKK